MGLKLLILKPIARGKTGQKVGYVNLNVRCIGKMVGKQVPQRLWDFCTKWCCEIRNKTAGNIFELNYRTPYEATLGDTPDISSLAAFDFYDLVWYHEETS